jgi:hypothetical protein
MTEGEHLNMKKVYVVMGLHPSHAMSEIKAVFKEKKKAEEYCFRHINCSIKEYSYSDDKTYTPLERVIIEGEINAQSLPDCTFEHLTKEDAGYKGEEFVCVFHIWGAPCFKFQINKILPDNYNEEIEKIKYAQILQDVINTSKVELKGIPLDGFGQMIRISDLIVSKLEKIIAEKFNVKIED